VSVTDIIMCCCCLCQDPVYKQCDHTGSSSPTEVPMLNQVPRAEDMSCVFCQSIDKLWFVLCHRRHLSRIRPKESHEYFAIRFKISDSCFWYLSATVAYFCCIL
jgi:hypothetical protein